MSRRSLYQVVGSNINCYRKQRGFTQEQLSQLSLVDRSYLARLERGRANPSIKVLCYLAQALGIPFPELVRVGRKKLVISRLHF